MPQLHHQDSGLGIWARSERPAGHLPKGIHHMAGGGGCVPGTLETGPPGPCPSSGLPNHCRQTAVALAVPDALLLFNRSGSCVRCPRRARGARAGYSRLCIPGRLPDGHAQPAHTYAYNCMSSHLITCGRRRARRRWWCGHWNSLPCMISREGATFFFFFNDGHCHQQNRNVFSRLQALPNSNPFEGSSTFSLYGRFLESI